MSKKTTPSRVRKKGRKAGATGVVKTRAKKVRVARPATGGASEQKERTVKTSKRLPGSSAGAKQYQRRLRESDSKVWALLETAAQGILAVGADGRINLANRAAEKMFGYRRWAMLGQPVEMLVPGASRKKHARHRRDFFSHPQTRPMGRGLDLFARRKNSSEFPVEISLSQVRLEDNVTAVAFITDITERKLAEKELQEEHAFNAALLDTVQALVVVLDRGGRVIRFNETCQRVTGYSWEEVRGKRVWDFLLDPAQVRPVKRVFEDLRARRFPSRFQNHWVTKDGQKRLISWSNTVSLGDDGTVKFIIGTGLDITEQAQMESALLDSRNELRQLTARLISGQEEDYKHLSRELHDVFSQKLAVLGMEVTDLERELISARIRAEQDLGNLGAQISGLATDIHGISRRLHPAILDDLGLAAALKNECLAFSRQHGIEVSFHSDEVPRSIPGDAARCLYRIAQESLANVRAHAQSDKVHVHLGGTRAEIVLSIEDFGKGFQPEKEKGKGGLGLISMKERVWAVRGELSIQSKPGDGTKVLVRVPLRKPRSRR